MRNLSRKNPIMISTWNSKRNPKGKNYKARRQSQNDKLHEEIKIDPEVKEFIDVFTKSFESFQTFKIINLGYNGEYVLHANKEKIQNNILSVMKQFITHVKTL